MLVDEKELLQKFNETETHFPEDTLVYEYLEIYAEKYPSRVALVFNDCEMTYQELNEKANRLAHLLVSGNVGKGKVVGIILERSFEMIASILAVLKAGAAYLPIDPFYPRERIEYCVANSGADYVLTNKKNCKAGFSSGVTVFYWDEAQDALENYSVKNLPRQTDNDGLAYLIYTSGSTGVPKGVMISHISLLNRLHWHIRNFSLTENDVLLQKTTYAFDVSVWELLCWCMVGCKLVILGPGDEKNSRKIIREIEKHGVTMIHFVPSVLELFLEYIDDGFDVSRLRSLKYIIASGEELTVPTVKKSNALLLMPNGTELWNLYGPTEATIDVTSFCCNEIGEGADRIPIGGPIDNIKLYVLDDDMKICGIGEKGDLYIGGVGVANGYVNNPQLTMERFIKNPYNENMIIYKTGDIASWNMHGQLIFYGRSDSQIKLRGLRIELGEIERKLIDIEGVKKAVVILDSRNENNKFLVAFYTARKELDFTVITDSLKKTLPDYMIPSRFLYVQDIMTNANGKADRKALTEMYQGLSV